MMEESYRLWEKEWDFVVKKNEMFDRNEGIQNKNKTTANDQNSP